MQELSIEELVEHNLLDLDNWNRTNGLDLTKQEARTALLSFLPSLKRWKKENKLE